MSYPIPRFGVMPKTPKQMDDDLLEIKSRPSNTFNAYKRYIVYAITAALLLFWARTFISSSEQTDRIPFTHDPIEDYFGHYEGHQACAISSTNLYIPAVLGKVDKHTHYCPSRASLLRAMSGGGRHGFDAPFHPAGCHYRWYSTPETCMILERFDAVVFIGDDMTKHIYAAFNMLLRENIATGGLRQWDMKENERETCRCDNQITKPECAKYALTDSEDVRKNDIGSGHPNPFYCNRTPHYFLPIDASPAPEELHNTFTASLAKDPDSWKPIPVIHSLGLSTSLSWADATASMDEWVALADASQRNVPFLWLGPNAAGHLKPPGQIVSQGNNALWHYTTEMAKEARSRELDALGMYNLTLQAASWDGSHYAQRVALVQAMMVINWLSRLETT